MSRGWIGALFVVAALGLSGCASDMEARNQQLSRENLDLAQQAEELRAQRAAESARNEAKEAQIKALERERQQLADERAEAIKRIEQWKAEAEKNAAAASSAPAMSTAGGSRTLSEIQGVPGLEGARLNEAGDIEIPMACDFSFGTGSADLSEAGRRALRALADKLNGEFASSMIRVEGHTDSQPVVKPDTVKKYGDNLGLSLARATTVSRFLQDELHISASRLITTGRGSQAPVADNKTTAGRAKNRRVELTIITSAQAK